MVLARGKSWTERIPFQYTLWRPARKRPGTITMTQEVMRKPSPGNRRAALGYTIVHRPRTRGKEVAEVRMTRINPYLFPAEKEILAHAFKLIRAGHTILRIEGDGGFHMTRAEIEAAYRRRSAQTESR